MKHWLARMLALGILGIVALQFQVNGRAQTNVAPNVEKFAAADKSACIKNLQKIYTAIQAYRMDHKDLPNWLSDLVPYYLDDGNILICPACMRSGQAETSALADPRLPSSYYYEFCPIPLDKAFQTDGSAWTHRDWKRRQMGLLGSAVPIVRCRHHGLVLNLSFDGRIYESGEVWETLFTNQINLIDLSPAKLFGVEPKKQPAKQAAAKKPAPAPPPELHFNPRPVDAAQNLVDLTPYYNAMLTDSWHGATGNNLASLPTGIHMLAGTEFDVRGIVQLAGKSPNSRHYPTQITGIKVRQKCERLEFLHAAGFGSVTNDGQRIGSYVVHFATGDSKSEIPILYGHDVRDWHALAGETLAPKELLVAWTGSNTVSQAANNYIRLFKTTWVNTSPTLEIESIDFVSAMNRPAPFLIAITAE